MTDHGGAASPRTEAVRKIAAVLRRVNWPIDGHRNYGSIPSGQVNDAASRLYSAGIRVGEAAQEAPAPEGLRERLRPIVSDWFEKGYDAGNLSADALTDRILAATPPTPAEPPRPWSPTDDEMRRLLRATHDAGRLTERTVAEARPPEGPDPAPAPPFVEAALALVDAVLDRPSADPDDDAAKAARAVLRIDWTARSAGGATE